MGWRRSHGILPADAPVQLFTGRPATHQLPEGSAWRDIPVEVGKCSHDVLLGQQQPLVYYAPQPSKARHSWAGD